FAVQARPSGTGWGSNVSALRMPLAELHKERRPLAIHAPSSSYVIKRPCQAQFTKFPRAVAAAALLDRAAGRRSTTEQFNVMAVDRESEVIEFHRAWIKAAEQPFDSRKPFPRALRSLAAAAFGLPLPKVRKPRKVRFPGELGSCTGGLT